MSHSILSTVLGSAVADAGTFTYSYPTGKDEGNFYLAMGHKLTVDGNKYNYPDDFDVTLGTASITITNKTGATWASGAAVKCQLEEPGKREYRDDMTGNLLASAVEAKTMLVSLGAPDAIVTNGICESQNRTGAGVLLINGALSNGDLSTSVATLDVPRNVIADSGGVDTAVITVTGTDVYGNAMSEKITLNGATAVAGKKAFKTITAVSSDATVTNGMFLGTGDVIGLPVFLPSAGHVLKEMADGVAATAGTFVAGVRTAGGATATDGDVRGTYDPNSACDGAIVFSLIVALPDPGFTGITQYTG